MAIAEYAWSGRERLGLLRVRGEAIVLHAMRWPDEIRDPSELAPGATEVTDEEISEAEHLIDRMTRADVEGPDFTDRYTDAIAKVIEAKRESRPLPEAPEPAAAPARVVDLMAALQESVRKTQAARVRTPQRPRDAGRVLEEGLGQEDREEAARQEGCIEEPEAQRVARTPARRCVGGCPAVLSRPHHFTGPLASMKVPVASAVLRAAA